MFSVDVERVATDRWRIWPQDETWLGLVASEALKRDPSSVTAVLKEHPQHEGVLLRGDLATLQEGLFAAKRRILEMSSLGEKALQCRGYKEALLLRRALMTRPCCLAADEVHFTSCVEDSDFEPMAAHRIGQLALRLDSDARLLDSQAKLVVPPGELAFGRHIQLPPGVSLAEGGENVCIGIRTLRTAQEPCLAAVIDLKPGSVIFKKHAKYRATTAVSYFPEIILEKPFPKGAAETLRGAGFSFSSNGTVIEKTFPVREEYVAQLLPEAKFRKPEKVCLDFEPLCFANKGDVLRVTFQSLLLEIDMVAQKLDQPVSSERRCPDIQH